MNEISRSNRCHIAIFGRRNTGKSSLLNCLARQDVSIVSDIAGTTTDVVWKNIELPGVGAAVIADTAGFDDIGVVGDKRVEATKRVLSRTDIAVLLLGDDYDNASLEKEWKERILALGVPLIFVMGKCDNEGSEERLKGWQKLFGESVIPFSSVTSRGLSSLFDRIAQHVANDDEYDDITYTLVKRGDIVVLVMPQDSSAPKGRLIQPQVQTLRNLLDKHCIPLCCAPEELSKLLNSLAAPPQLIITDSQVFTEVERVAPPETKLTSFSVLMARHKGDIGAFLEGAQVLLSLKPTARILIAEACSHVPQNEDIGRVKLPRLLRSKLGDRIVIEIVSGHDFPDNLTGYDLIIHCGACMFNRRSVISRVRQAKAQGVSVTNYGIAIAALNGILKRIAL